MKAVVTQIERGAAYDGPGLRTVVFFKGCPLNCLWCANPETQKAQSELYFDEKLCIGCGECQKSCCDGICSVSERALDCVKLAGCGKCVSNCPTGAIKVVGKAMSANEIFDEVVKDSVFFETTGGGVTLSGGEVLTNAKVALEVLKLCRNERIHTAVETSGFGNTEDLMEIARYTDLFLFDIKHPLAEVHREVTGVSNEMILRNLELLVQQGAAIVVRMPLIPGINDDLSAVEALVALMKKLSLKELHVLPYHSFARDKYRKLARDFFEPDKPGGLSPEEIAQIAGNAGIETKIGGIN